MDDGHWYLCVFDKEKVIVEFDVNAALKLNNHTIPIAGFAQPFASSAFINDDRIFLNVFHNATLMHYHLIYSISAQGVVSNIGKRQFTDCTSKNLPWKTFYNDEDDEIYTFYRQGHGMCLSLDSNVDKLNRKQNYGPSTYDVETHVKWQKVHDADLGQMYLFNNRALIVRSSSKILFFKLEKDSLTRRKSWELYKEIPSRGFIYWIKGNKRIQITTDEKIEFYTIDPDTFEPKLENTMNNFMQCNQMMFGAAVKYCITYKTNQMNFNIYTAKFQHNFKVITNSQNFEGTRTANLTSNNVFIASDINQIQMFCSKTYFEFPDNKIKVNLMK